MTLQIEARAFRLAGMMTAPDVPAEASAPVEVEISFSSELPYRRVRWDDGAERAEAYHEVLGHDPGEADLSILNAAGAPLLKDHRNSVDAQVGTVVRAWLSGGRGYARLRFSRDPQGQALAARVLAGEVVNVSVGYDVEDAIDAGTAEDGIPIVRVTRWRPREISIVAVPADPSVGFRRSDGADHPRFVSVSRVQEKPAMPEQTPETPTQTRAAAPAAPVDHSAAIAAAMSVERARVADIEAVAERFKLPAEMVRKARDGGMSAEEFNRAALDHLASPDATRARESRAAIGMTDKDKGQFRFFRLLAHLAAPADRDLAHAAGFEIETCRAAAQAKRNSRSDYTIPADVLNDALFATRAASANSQLTSSSTDGGALVPTDYRAGSFIDALRNRLSITQAGATVLQGLSGPVDIPKQTGQSTAYWIGEGADVTGSKPTSGLVTMTPHTMAIKVEYTRRMLMQADPSVEAFLRNEIVAKAALEIDAVALNGSAAAAAPNGLLDYITKGTWTSATNPSRNELIDLITAIKTANAGGSGISWVFNAATGGKMRKTLLDAGSGRFLLEGDRLLDLPYVESNQAASWDVFAGEWSQFLIGFWSGLDIRVDPYTLADSDGHLLRAFQDVDFQVRHAAAFAAKG